MGKFYDHYSTLSDAALERFAKHESDELKPEAYGDLIRALNARGNFSELISKMKRMENALSENNVMQEALKIMNAQCPICGSNSKVNFKKVSKVFSLILFSRFSTNNCLCCKDCFKKEVINACIFTLLLGPWGIPFGIIGAPITIIGNIIAYTRFNEETPSDELLEFVEKRIKSNIVVNNWENKK